MPKARGLLRLSKYFRAFLWLVVLAAAVCLVVRNIGVFGNILLVLLGFGAVILVHEFGHFIVAKLSGIKVEAFSIFMPPILLGVRKTEDGFRFRILPKLFPKEGDESGDGRLSFTVGGKGVAGETEYRIGLIPFGGFVKMLGQDDTGPARSSGDPRSYANKPISVRMAVITAGVVFNALSAVVIFMMVFLVGIKLPPAVVGDVLPASPAARVGLAPGDEIIEIAGKSDNLDFSNIAIAAALSDVNEAVRLKVRHQDGSVEDFAIVSEKLPGSKLRVFGVTQPQSLTVAEVSEPEELLKRTGLHPGDHIRAVNGKDVQSHWEMAKVVQDAPVPVVTVLAEREGRLIESQIRLNLSPARREVESESDLSHIYSMVPRLRIMDVAPLSAKDRFLYLLNRIGIGEVTVAARPCLKKDDIVLAVGDIENPTYKEIRDAATEYEDRELPIRVLRSDANGTEEDLTVTVVPRRSPDGDRVLIGIGIALDAEHAVVAKTIAAEDGPEPLAIPRGAVITAINGLRVSNFYDIIRQISQNAGRRVTIDWRLNKKVAGGVAVDVVNVREFVAVGSALPVPFKALRRLYKASGPVDAVGIGCKKTIMFITQAYATLKSLVQGLVGPKDLMGPVGILAVSYHAVAREPLVYYVYFLGLISAVIAVFNFLPLPPLDGGLIVLLLVEKIKGSALSGRTQGIIANAGWVLIGTLLLYVTFNDIVRSFF